MNASLSSIVMAAAGAAVYAGILISIPLRAKKLMHGCGEKILDIPTEPSTARHILIFIICALLIAVIPLRNFASYLNIIFIGTALFGTEITAREAILSRKNGIYANKIISGTYAIDYEQIEALPTLAYEDDPETTNVDRSALQIILKSGARLQLTFTTKELREDAVKAILSIRPELHR